VTVGVRDKKDKREGSMRRELINKGGEKRREGRVRKGEGGKNIVQE